MPQSLWPLKSPPKRRGANCRRFLHDDEARAIKMLDQAPRHDCRHDLPGVALSLPAVEAQREREGVGEVIGGGRREAIGRVGHGAR